MSDIGPDDIRDAFAAGGAQGDQFKAALLDESSGMVEAINAATEAIVVLTGTLLKYGLPAPQTVGAVAGIAYQAVTEWERAS